MKKRISGITNTAGKKIGGLATTAGEKISGIASWVANSRAGIATGQFLRSNASGLAGIASVAYGGIQGAKGLAEYARATTEEEKKAAIGSSLGGAGSIIGGIAGTIIGGPVGAAIGTAAGQIAGELFGSIFGEELIPIFEELKPLGNELQTIFTGCHHHPTQRQIRCACQK